MNFTKILFHFVFYTKKILKKPPEREILIFDRDLSELLIQCLPKKKVEIFDNRFLFKKGESFNVYIFLCIIFKFRWSRISYITEYIKVVKPKIIISHICSNITFYKLKNYFPEIKFLIIQHGQRSLTKGDLFYNYKMLNKLNLKCDYLFTHNYKIGKMYKLFSGGNIVPIGSFDSNLISKKKNNKKYEFTFISNYRHQASKHSKDI